MPKGTPINPAINPYTNIPIPDDVYVEEQYEDILEIVNKLLPHFEGVELDNYMPVGRLKGAYGTRIYIGNPTNSISVFYKIEQGAVTLLLAYGHRNYYVFNSVG